MPFSCCQPNRAFFVWREIDYMNTKKINIICQYCGKKFKVVPSLVKIGKGKYCSRDCYYKGREYLSGENHPQYKRIKKICPVCNKEFSIRPSRIDLGCGRFCSMKCRRKGEQTKRVKIQCLICKKEFILPPSQAKGTRFCSRKCFYQWRKGQRSPLWNKVKKICIICDKEFYVRPYRKLTAKYCSHKCHSQDLKYGSKEITLKILHQKRKAMMRNGGKLTTKIIQRVYEDNIKKFGTLTCIYCLNPIQFGDDTLEHKQPLAKGGTNLYENLGIACKSCNSKKRDRTEKKYREVIKNES